MMGQGRIARSFSTNLRTSVAARPICPFIWRERVYHITDDEQLKAIAKQGGLVGILALPERVGEGEVGVDDMLKHMDYIINLIGIEHMALGMDFVKYDGPRTLKDRHHPLHKDPLIKGFEEIEDLPNLIDGLQKHGYKDDDIRMILGGNYLRVLKTILPEQSVI